jgi:hypothetical protein
MAKLKDIRANRLGNVAGKTGFVMSEARARCRKASLSVACGFDLLSIGFAHSEGIADVMRSAHRLFAFSNGGHWADHSSPSSRELRL